MEAGVGGQVSWPHTDMVYGRACPGPICLPPPWQLPERVAWPRPPLCPLFQPCSASSLIPEPSQLQVPPSLPWGLCPWLPEALLPALLPTQQPQGSAGSSLTMSVAGPEDTAQGHQSCCGQSTGQRRRPHLSGPGRLGSLGSLGRRSQDPFMARRSCCPISRQAWPFLHGPSWLSSA